MRGKEGASGEGEGEDKEELRCKGFSCKGPALASVWCPHFPHLLHTSPHLHTLFMMLMVSRPRLLPIS